MLQRPGPIPPIQPPAGQAHKTAISWNPAYLAETVKKVEGILVDSGANVFVFDGQLVCVMPHEVLGASIWHARGEEPTQKTITWELKPLTAGALGMEINKFAYFFNDDKSNKSIDAPKSILGALLSPDLASSQLPMLRGISRVPYLYSDGTFSEPGYDERLQIKFDTADLNLDELIREPTFDQCREALDCILDLICEFPFSSPVDRGVAVCGFLSAVARRSVATCPMVGFTAPTRGSGKSLLTDMISIVVTGSKAPIINYGSNQDEFEKRIDTVLLRGYPLVSIDNIEAPLRSSTLNSYLTGSDVQIRQFLTQQNRRAVPSIMFFANGNNLSVADDLDRRMLLAELDPIVERPELEPHSFNAIQLCREFRTGIVGCLFTILRGYIAAGSPLGARYILGGFEEWSEHILAALLWVADGHSLVGNPLDSIERIRQDNPVISFELEFKRTWHGQFKDAPVHVSELLGPTCRDQPIFQAIKDLVGASHGNVSSKSLGWHLRNIKGRSHDGYRLIECDRKKGSIRWRVIHEGEK